ncbi:recombinase RecT [Xenorhabdus sp. KJ12.1]|uniref:recombinase RecT n=1 Tax=Xenorhabdus sp. KJ12.1 TaxID=1851571 RepID=UPI000C05483E|nr:recombinase RecT [Xenorhabdus sp. KJ12.1]PHM72204.1 DNA recombination protein RecT [Xenorhabdus sp. KJ12.1]
MGYNNKNRRAYKGKNDGYRNKSNINEIAQLDTVTRHLVSLKNDFEAAATWNPTLSFSKESVFAKHAINNNPYLTSLALMNLKSFEVAFLQLATSGLTLDPAQRMAYLVPRMNRVFLDVSYIGLSRMATDEGLCEDIVVELVFEKDHFKSNGRRQSPEHSFDPFANKGDLLLTTIDEGKVGDRGHFRGVYVDYRMKNGRNLVYFLTKSELASARAVSETWKSVDERKASPWVRFPWAMVRKSAIKQTIHQIPGNRTRVASIIDYLNKDGGEGFRDKNATPVEAAEYEMSARHAAKHHDVQPDQSTQTPTQNAASGNVYEGEVVHTNKPEAKTEESVKNDQVQPDPSNNATVTPTQNTESDVKAEDMSDVPGVRLTSKRRIDKLVKRVAKTMAYETTIAEVKTAFQFNDSEIKLALHCIEESRRNLLQSKLTEAVNKCDFTDVENFVNKLTNSEFKQKSHDFVQKVQNETNSMRTLYDEAIKTNNFSAVDTAIEKISFKPLKTVLSEIISAAKAA